MKQQKPQGQSSVVKTVEQEKTALKRELDIMHQELLSAQNKVICFYIYVYCYDFLIVFSRFISIQTFHTAHAFFFIDSKFSLIVNWINLISKMWITNSQRCLLPPVIHKQQVLLKRFLLFDNGFVMYVAFLF